MLLLSLKVHQRYNRPNRNLCNDPDLKRPSLFQALGWSRKRRELRVKSEAPTRFSQAVPFVFSTI